MCDVQVLDDGWNERSVIESIISNGETDPFYVCDLSDVIWKYKNWMKIMPRVQPFYAMKCNDTMIILQTLAKMGCNFDCASAKEISTILSLGVHPDRIIFANPMKKNTHLRYAAEVGVKVMTFDCVNELYKTKKFHPEARLVLRIRHDDKSAKFVVGQKYGVRTESEAEQLLTVASRLDLEVIGVSFHIGTDCGTISTYEYAMESASKIFEIAKKFGYRFTLLDIGGGFPGHKGSSIEKIGEVVNNTLEKFFSDPAIRIISEPGRYFCSSAFTLLSQINTKKTVEETDPNTNRDELTMYILDISVFNSLIFRLVGECYKFQPLKQSTNDGIKLPSIIWGPTCNCFDLISDGVEYLPEMDVGEWLIFENAGSYTVALASDWNGFERPKIHTIVKPQDRFLLEEIIGKNKLTSPEIRIHCDKIVV